MTRKEIGAADSHRPADTIVWRQFWLANVITDMGRPATVNAIRPERRTRRDSLTRRLHRLHHMRAMLGPPR